MRDHTICMLMVTKPEMTAQVSQNVAPVAVTLAGVEINSPLTLCATLSRLVAFESTRSATTPIRTFVVAAIQIVARTPKVGSRKNPAAIVPAIAPARLHAYNVLIAFFRAWLAPTALASTGSVAPINAVGIRRTI